MELLSRNKGNTGILSIMFLQGTTVRINHIQYSLIAVDIVKEDSHSLIAVDIVKEGSHILAVALFIGKRGRGGPGRHL